jgi:ubiquinone/menaquinone biosynthesis C-methylase UbiE
MQQTAHSHVPLSTAGQSAGRQGFAHPAHNAVRLGIEPGMSVADFGAGSGAYIWPIAESLANSGHLYAIDVQQDLLRRIHNEAQKRGITNVKIIWADLEKPKSSKIASHSLDVVLVSNLLFQIEDKRAVFAEAKRVLKEGGKLAVIDWSDSFNMMGPHKKDVVTKEEGKKLLEECGFKADFEFAAGAHHWGLVARPART